MKLSRFQSLNLLDVDFNEYDLVLMASGFEERARFILSQIGSVPASRLVVFGFDNDRDKLSRLSNDAEFRRYGAEPLVFSDAEDYEKVLRSELLRASQRAGASRAVRIFVDYSVMTRAWYGYILTWLKYSSNRGSVDVDFAYAHGKYSGEFQPLRIREISAIPGFEGACVSTRSTVAAFGLGFDRYALLAVYEQIEPDSLFCFLAQERLSDEGAGQAVARNQEIISISGVPPVMVPLGDLEETYRILHEEFSRQDGSSEIVAVPMGPKPHVLTCLLLAQAIPRVTCLHAKGYRSEPVQVEATGTVSLWRLSYR